MKCAALFLGVLIACSGFRCEKDSLGDCTVLRKALIHLDLAVIETEINYHLGDLMPQPTAGDAKGHEVNLDVFIDRLKNNCDFNAALGCYACIETFPELSEVYITLDSLGTEVFRVVDISTPDNASMTFRGVH